MISKPSYKELFTKILVAFDNMDSNYIYYLDVDDYHVKRASKKAFNYFRRHYADLTYSDDPNSEEYLFASICLENGKYLLPPKLSEAELKKSYDSLPDKEDDFLTFKNQVLKVSIDIWLDYHHLFEIEASDYIYKSVFHALAVIFNSNFFTYWNRGNILHFRKHDLYYFYSFNRKDGSLTIALNYFGLSNIQCLISNADMFNKYVLRTLRNVFVITFKKESRCTHETISLYERFESDVINFADRVPKITFYNYGLLQENRLRQSDCNDLCDALVGLIEIIQEIYSTSFKFSPKDCILYEIKDNNFELKVDPDITIESKEPFVNLYPYRQFSTNVRINKGQCAEFIMRVSSTKKVSKLVKATVYELLLIDSSNNEVLFHNFVESNYLTVKDIMLSLIEHGYTNGYPEHITVSSILDSHILNIVTAGKTRTEFGELLAIKKYDEDDGSSPQIMA